MLAVAIPQLRVELQSRNEADAWASLRWLRARDVSRPELEPEWRPRAQLFAEVEQRGPSTWEGRFVPRRLDPLSLRKLELGVSGFLHRRAAVYVAALHL